MPQVKLSNKAQEDLGRLYHFLADKDASAASRAIETIEGAFLTLAKFPEIYIDSPMKKANSES